MIGHPVQALVLFDVDWQTIGWQPSQTNCLLYKNFLQVVEQAQLVWVLVSSKLTSKLAVKYIEVISRVGRSISSPRSWTYGLSRFGEVRTFKTEGKVFLDTDRPRPGNNILIFLLSFTSGKCTKNRCVNQECFYCGAWRVQKSFRNTIQMHWRMSKTVNVIPNTEKSFWKPWDFEILFSWWCRERSGTIWLSLLAIFNTLFWVNAYFFYEKTDKTRKYLKSTIFVWYKMAADVNTVQARKPLMLREPC